MRVEGLGWRAEGRCIAVQFSTSEQLLRRNVKRFRGGLVFKAHRLVYHSTLGLRIIKKKKRVEDAAERTWFTSTEMCGGSEASSYLRLIDSCITQLKAQGPSRTYKEIKEDEEALGGSGTRRSAPGLPPPPSLIFFVTRKPRVE